MELADSPRKPLSELIGNLGYSGPAEKRKSSGESLTKRRRIELQDPSTLAVLSRKPEKTRPDEKDSPQPKKRSRSPAKKPRTVTEAATAAYQPPRAAVEADSTTSKFFSPEKAAEKPKKPRKPRANATEASSTTTKKPERPKKAKVTFQETLPPLLYSPQHANEQAERQSFLFGTSSQLAAEESPTFIRQMQAAIIESELVPSTQAMAICPAKMSCAKVPTAPHGTSLSVSQAENEHWRAASRDWNGGLLSEKSGLKPRKMPPKTAARPTVTESQSDSLKATTTTQHAPKLPEKPQRAPPPEPDSFINIDEISDHESPPTPSPPRRKASASPSLVQPLTFNMISSPAPADSEQPVKAPLASSAALKPTDAQWPIIKAQLFPQITAALKTAPRSTDSAKPSWHQKILLYDPIVLEDLTAWLNAQDLRIGVQRQKPKKGAKGRKKKGVEGSAEGGVRSEPEVEVVHEEVKAWIVQKWCEEKSVCCLWKEGLRGGVRSKY